MLRTTTKLRIARLASRLLVAARSTFGAGAETAVTRHGLRWYLNLREGIDLAIYLGVYETDTLNALAKRVREGDVVIDIGANIGALSLPLAVLVGATGRVHAFEPTTFAFGKLRENLALNARIEARVIANQTLLVEAAEAAAVTSLHASWPLDTTADLHPLHCGRLMPLDGARHTTLDDYMRVHAIERVDLIKLDVDGNELRVIEGALATLTTHRPLLVFELAPYILDERPGTLERLLEILGQCGYDLMEMRSGRALPAQAAALRAWVPQGCGLNVIGNPL